MPFATRFLAKPISLLLLGAAALPAFAHIILETPQAAAGSFYKAVFLVTHGCAGSPVQEVVVSIPEGVQGAKPMPKAGWQLEVVKAPLSQPRTSHGKAIAEDTASVRWSGGNLADAWTDEFVVFAKLPEQPGRLYWKVSQICADGRIDWTDVPSAEKSPTSLKTPAPALELLPAAAHDHAHH